MTRNNSKPSHRYSGGKYQIIQIKKLRKYFGDSCEFCSSTIDLQFAHKHGHDTGVSGSSRGSWYRLQDVLLHPLSFLLLCRKCHCFYDKKFHDICNRKCHCFYYGKLHNTYDKRYHCTFSNRKSKNHTKTRKEVRIRA